MSKSDDFVDLLVDYIQDEDDVVAVVAKLKVELNAVGFNPSDSLIVSVTPVEDDDDDFFEDEEDEDEIEIEGWDEDEDED